MIRIEKNDLLKEELLKLVVLSLSVLISRVICLHENYCGCDICLQIEEIGPYEFGQLFNLLDYTPNEIHTCFLEYSERSNLTKERA